MWNKMYLYLEYYIACQKKTHNFSSNPKNILTSWKSIIDLEGICSTFLFQSFSFLLNICLCVSTHVRIYQECISQNTYAFLNQISDKMQMYLFGADYFHGHVYSLVMSTVEKRYMELIVSHRRSNLMLREREEQVMPL